MKKSSAFNFDNTAPTCGSTSQSSASTSVTGYVNCSDDHSGCVKSQYSELYTSNGEHTITIEDTVGNTRDCSVSITKVVSLPTISAAGGNGSSTTTSDSVCCNAKCKSGGKCYYSQWSVNAKGGTINSDSYVRGTITGVGTYYRYYNNTSINYFGATWNSGTWYIARSASFNTARGKICTNVGCSAEA